MPSSDTSRAALSETLAYAREVSVDVYRFRPFDRADLTTAERWLQTPEVVRWWGDPAHELTLLTEDLSALDGSMDRRI